MYRNENNYAFIDSQNLNVSVLKLGWSLDFAKFRIYLKEKYAVTKAYLFIGYLWGNLDLYRSLEKQGYILIYKPTLPKRNGGIKGNVDAELVLYSLIHYDKYDQAVIVTGDGDFSCLVSYLLDKEKLKTLLCPDRFRYSALLKHSARKKIAFMNGLGDKLSYKRQEKNPEGRNLKGGFSWKSNLIILFYSN